MDQASVNLQSAASPTTVTIPVARYAIYRREFDAADFVT